MARISGLSLEKHSNGSIKKVTFDYKKHSELLKPILENMGAVEEDDFDKRIKSGELFTLEEAKVETKRRIRLWWEK